MNQYNWKHVTMTLAVTTAFALTAGPALAHPGNTDKSGGHKCKTNCAQYGLQDGQYHFHDATGKAVLTNPTQKPAEVKPQAPSAPTQVKATPGVEQVTVSWNPSTDAVKGYLVNVDGKQVTPEPIQETTYTVTNLEAGKYYQFTVSAISNDNLYGHSAPDSATPEKKPEPKKEETQPAEKTAVAASAPAVQAEKEPVDPVQGVAGLLLFGAMSYFGFRWWKKRKNS